MPYCVKIFGVEVCIPTVDDIINGISNWINNNLEPWFEEQIGDLWSGITQISSAFIQTLSDLNINVIDSIAKSMFYSFAYFSTIFNSSLTYLQNAIAEGLGGLAEGLSGAIAGITSTVEAQLSPISQSLDSLVTVTAPITELINSLNTTLSNIPTTLVSLPDTILGGFGSLLDSMTTAVNNSINSIAERFIELRTSVEGITAGIIEGISNMVERMTALSKALSYENITNTLTQLELPLETIRIFTCRYIPLAIEQAESFLEPITKRVIKTLVDEVAKSLRGEESAIPFWDLVVTAVNALMTAIADNVRAILEFEPPLTFEKAYENAKRYLTLLGTMSTMELFARLTDTLIAMVGDVEIMGTKLPGRVVAMTKPFSSLVRGIYWNMGFGWLTWAIWGELIRATITEGLQRYYRERYRTREPSLSMIQEAYRRGLISEDEAERYFAYLGYEDRWFNILKSTAWYYLPPSTIQEFYARGLIDRDTAKELLTQYGIRPEYHDYYLETAYRYVSVSDLLEAYVRGFVDEEFTKERLRFYGYRDKDIELLLQLISKRLTYSVIFEAYEWGIVDEDYMASYLRQLGYRDEELAIMIEIGRLRAISDEISRLKNAILNVYEIGYLTRDEAMRMLTGTKIPREQVELLLKAKDYEKMYNTITDYVNAVARLFRDEKIDEVTFRIMVAPFIQDPEIVESLIAYERSLREKKPAFILPPVFRNRGEYLLAQFNSLSKQYEYLSKLLQNEMEELDFIINTLNAELAEVGEELKPAIREQIEYFTKLREQRRKYYGYVLGKLAVMLDVLRRLLQKYGIVVS